MSILGTSAPLYMDIMTIYIGFLPLFLAISVYFAVKKQYKTHLISQGIILAFSLCIILYFEVMTRLENNFIVYAKNSNLAFDFIVIFLVIHIIIATASLAGWVYLFISSYKAYKKDGFETLKTSKHKKIGKAIFVSMSLSSLMGVCMYLFLFVI